MRSCGRSSRKPCGTVRRRRSRSRAEGATLETIAVVGASLAGLRSVETLRREGFGGRIVLVGAEPHLPYDRPPLSKELLAGAREPDDIALRRQGYEDLDIEMRLERRAVALEGVGEAGFEVLLHDGERVVCDGVVVATGASPRLMPGEPALAGLLTLRTLDDALALRELVGVTSGPVVVIGAGFIGAEVAATCRGRGIEVTVLEALAAPMVRGLGPEVGGVLADLHRSHGVDLRLRVRVDGFTSDDGAVTGVGLADGSVIAASVVIVAVGVTPTTDWLEGSGLALDDGVVCDETLLAAPGVVAAGDVARWPNPRFGGESMRLEHWTNATESGVHAARRLLGHDDAFAPVPFVWSDQYDVKIQTVGQVRGDDDLVVVDGSLAERRFAAVFARDEVLVGAVAFDRPRPLMLARRMIGARLVDALADLGAA
jgi:3-phenylpropionate/trans-cinnamate dioxygenase ferredoxin reductase component